MIGAYDFGRPSMFSFSCKVTQDAGVSSHDVKAKNIFSVTNINPDVHRAVRRNIFL